MCVCVDKKITWGIVPQKSFTLFFETGSLIDLSLAYSDRLTGQQVLGKSLPSQHWGYKCTLAPVFLVVCQGSNSGLYACAENT